MSTLAPQWVSLGPFPLEVHRGVRGSDPSSRASLGTLRPTRRPRPGLGRASVSPEGSFARNLVLKAPGRLYRWARILHIGLLRKIRADGTEFLPNSEI